jgi:DNA mismatch endonuclease, patch repair protein
MDNLSQEHRSWNMRQIKSGNTKPELTIRSLLHSMGYRFRLNRNDLPGRPDIVLPKYKTVIFVHGCFWHRHKGCKFSYTPKSNVSFWNEKFKTNILRDKEVKKQLKSLKWRTFVIWECELSNIKMLKNKIRMFFDSLYNI